MPVLQGLVGTGRGQQSDRDRHISMVIIGHGDCMAQIWTKFMGTQRGASGSLPDGKNSLEE